jgi:hypothetical protein
MRARPMRTNLFRQAAMLGAASLLTALGAVAAVASASAATTGSSQQAASQAIPIPPAGWHPKAIARPWLNPHATMRIVTLSPTACSALNKKRPGAAPNCTVRYYFLKEGGNHQALPPGTRFAAGTRLITAETTALASSSYWYWGAYSFVECSNSAVGCTAWNVNLTIDGIANGAYVYVWNEGCSPSGFGYDVECTWTGNLHDGGAYQSWCGCDAMQFGDDSQESVAGSIGVLDIESGQRVWVDIFGDWFNYSSWGHGL